MKCSGVIEACHIPPRPTSGLPIEGSQSSSDPEDSHDRRVPISHSTPSHRVRPCEKESTKP